MGRIHSLIIIVVFFCSICFLNSAWAEGIQNLPCLQEFYHDWQDGSYDVATQNGYAYLACGLEGIHVLDISDLNDIRDVAHIAKVPAKSVAIAGNRLYLGSSGIGVYSYDVSDPLHPVEAGLIQMTDVSTVNSIRVQGRYLCVCGTSTAGRGLSFIDLGAGDTFDLLWSSHSIPVASDIEIRDQLAYVGGGSKLLVLDVSKMAAPMAIDSLVGQRWEEVLGLALKGDYVFLASGDAGLRVMDIHSHQIVAQITDLDPNVPTDEDYPIAVRIVGSTAYVHYNIYECPLAIIDVSDPIHPDILSNYYPADNISKFVVDGSNVFVADQTAGVRVLNVTDLSNPVETHSFNDFDQDRRIAGMVGDIAYIQQTNRVVAVDLSDPLQPRERAVVTMEVPPWSDTWFEQLHHVEVAGSYGYCLMGPHLMSLDLSDPDRITIVDRIDVPETAAYAGFFSLAYPYAYLPADTGLAVIDVSNPLDLKVDERTGPISNLSNTPVNGYLVRISTQGFYLCPLADARSPHWIGPFHLDWTNGAGVTCGRVVGDKFYVATWKKLGIYSLTDRTLLSVTPITDLLSMEMSVTDMEVVDNLAYFSVRNAGVEVYDVGNPQYPMRTGYNESAVEANDLFVRGDLVYVAAESHLAIYQYLGPAADGSAREMRALTYELQPNFPNPFNATTTIGFDLANAGQMSLTIYNALGQKVVTLADGFRPAGHYQFQWDGSSSSGSIVASGVYVYRLQAGQTVMNRKMTLLH